MKKAVRFIILSSFFFFGSGTLKTSYAQFHMVRNQGFFIGTEGFYGHSLKMATNWVIDLGSFNPDSYGFKVSANWFLNYNWSVGSMVGLLDYEGPHMLTLPILINTQRYFSQGSNTPFAYAEAGYGVRFNNDNQDKGFLYELGMGYRYRVNWSNFVVFKLGYHSYNNKEWKWERKLGSEFNQSDPYRWYNLKRQTLTFTVGFYYSTRY